MRSLESRIQLEMVGALDSNLSNREKYEAYKDLLPPEVEFVDLP